MKSRFVFTICSLLLVTSAQANQRFIGVTEAIHDVELSLQVDGIAAAIKVEEGQRVKEGAELLRLDDRLQAYESQRRRVVLEDQSRLQTARHNEAILASMLKTSRELFDRTGSVSAEEVKKLEMQHANALGELQALEKEEKREAIELDIAKTEVERRALYAPISGVVTDVRVEVGEWARAGEAVVRVVDTSRCYLVVNIEERFARQLSAGSETSVYVATGNEELLTPGKVLFVSPVADRASGLVRVKIEFANQEGKIWPGMPASVEFADARIGGASNSLSQASEPLPAMDIPIGIAKQP